jgi:hypothetical protein
MWSDEELKDLLSEVAEGTSSVDKALIRLRRLACETGDGICLDHHRALRQGMSEVIFCAPKTTRQVADIFARLAARNDQVLGTRATPEQFEATRKLVPEAQYHESARAIWLDRKPRRAAPGVLLITAGTADLPVADEAALTLELLGHRPMRLTDVGVAGLHRLLAHVEAIQAANVIIVVAGMEGALPSVVGGLVGAPVIAVPTSVGYGTGLGGIAALLGMLNSCAPGVCVMNIDNGYGAGHLAAMINRRCPPQIAPDSAQTNDEATEEAGDETKRQANPSPLVSAT